MDIQKTKILNQKKAVVKTLYTIFFMIMAFCMVLGIASYLKRERESQHTPVTVKDIDVNVTVLEKKAYPVTAKAAEKIDNVQYYDVTIGGEYIRMDEDTYKEKVQGNDQITTEIYVFTAKNKQDYLLDNIKGGFIKTARFSFLEEAAFSDDEIENLTLQSAETLTDIKYEALGYIKDINITDRFYIERPTIKSQVDN